MNFKVYVVSAISHLTSKQVYNRFNPIISKLKQYDYVVLHPVIWGDELDLASDKKLKPTGMGHNVERIPKRDRWMVEQADIIFADLTKLKKVTIGSLFEIAWAKLLNKHIIIIMEKNNVHQHLFVKEAATEIFETLEEGFEYLIKFSKIF